MPLDPATVGLLKDSALAVLVILMVSGMLVPKSQHDFVKNELAKSQAREAESRAELAKTVDELGENTSAMNTIRDALRELSSDVRAGRRRVGG